MSLRTMNNGGGGGWRLGEQARPRKENNGGEGGRLDGMRTTDRFSLSSGACDRERTISTERETKSDDNTGGTLYTLS